MGQLVISVRIGSDVTSIPHTSNSISFVDETEFLKRIDKYVKLQVQICEKDVQQVAI